MNASFEEKSAWIQLLSLLVVIGGYLVVATSMIQNGVTHLAAFIPLFAAAVVLLVIILVAGMIVVAAASGSQTRDERDRLIGWRSESNSSWILGGGVLIAIGAMTVAIANVWVAHLLLFSLLLSEVVKFGFQIIYYRKGI